MAKPYVDVGFVIPLREELIGLTATFPTLSDEISGTQFKAALDLGVSGVTAVAYLQDEMG